MRSSRVGHSKSGRSSARACAPRAYALDQQAFLALVKTEREQIEAEEAGKGETA